MFFLMACAARVLVEMQTGSPNSEGQHYAKLLGEALVHSSNPSTSTQIQGDSLARGPKLLSIKNYVSQLTDDELTTGYYQQDGATCRTSNASMRQIQSFFKDRIISKNLWPPRSPDLMPADFFLWGLLQGKVYKNTPHTIEQLKDAVRQQIQAVNIDTLGKVF